MYNKTVINEVITLRENNTSIEGIAKQLNLSEGTVRNWCRKYNLGGVRCKHKGNQYSNRNKQLELAKEKYLSGKSWEYTEGFTTIDEHSIFKCKKCGCKQEISWVNFRSNNRKNNPTCLNCLEINKEKLKRLKLLDREEAKRLKRVEISKRGIQASFNFCECGEAISIHSKRCKECNKRIYNATHEHKRRMLTKQQLVDKDISLKKLSERDGNVCWTCGQKVNWEDKKEVKGIVICGEDYPSIDHIIPLSKGGEHSWQNIKLCHRRCNTKNYHDWQKDAPLGVNF